MRRISLAAAAATIAGLAFTFMPAASATSVPCGDSGHCAGRLSHQTAPLEIAVGVPFASLAGIGTPIVGKTPAFKATGDWHLAALPSSTSPDRMFKFAPFGNITNLCITAVSDTPRSQLRLAKCVPGSAGSSHQLWHPINIIGNGFRVWQNDANGLVMTLVNDTSGTPLQIRSMGTGTGGNKNFVRSVPF